MEGERKKVKVKVKINTLFPIFSLVFVFFTFFLPFFADISHAYAEEVNNNNQQQRQVVRPTPPTPPTPPIPPIQIDIGEGREGVLNAMRIMILLTILTLAPSFLILMTSFTRIVIVLFLLRQAIGVIQVPPNQVIVGLALFLSIFIMKPALEESYKNAFVPYAEGRMPEEVFFKKAFDPFKKFMLAQVGEKELDVFVKIAGKERPKSPDDISAEVLVPAFVVSEIKKAFEIGFLVYIPFIIIDITIASILMAMGMIMVPPIMLSIPFKLIVFVLADGWNLLIASMVGSFAR